VAPAWLEKFIVREDPSPDPRRASEKPTLKLQYQSLADHRRILTVEGEKTETPVTPLYKVTRKAVLGAWGSKCSITANDKEVAVIQYNTFSYQIKFPARNDHRIDISYGKRTFGASGGLGTLTWKGTGMEVAGAASWELRDESSLVMVVGIDQTQTNGWVTLWKEGLGAQMVEELVVVGVSQIEEYKRMLRNSKKSFVGATISA
jgi:hypothetical protein